MHCTLTNIFAGLAIYPNGSRRELKVAAHLCQEVEVGHPGEHEVQEEGQEGDDVVLRGADGIALVALIQGVWAQPAPISYLEHASYSCCPADSLQQLS